MSATLAGIVSAAIQLPHVDRLTIFSQLLETMRGEEHLPSVNDDDFIEELQRCRNESVDRP